MHSGPLIPLWAELETPAKSIREKALCIKMLGEYHGGMNGYGGPLVFVSASNLQYVCVSVCVCVCATGQDLRQRTHCLRLKV